jgi:hypothetical protein
VGRNERWIRRIHERRTVNESRVGRISFAKVVTVLAVLFGIGLGLCGLDYLLAAKGIGKSTVEFGVGPLDGVSLVVMILSAFGLVIAVIAWIITAAVGSVGKKVSQPQKLFDEGDDTNLDRKE